MGKKELVKQYMTYHCTTAKVLSYGKIDTSICAVFYARDREELATEFLPRLRKYAAKENSLIQVYAKMPVMAQLEDDDGELAYES